MKIVLENRKFRKTFGTTVPAKPKPIQLAVQAVRHEIPMVPPPATITTNSRQTGSEGSEYRTSDHLTASSAVDPQTYFTVRQFSLAEPAFSEAALRGYIFKAETRQSTKGVIAANGLAEYGALLRIGRKVLIHRQRFLAWVQADPASLPDSAMSVAISDKRGANHG